MVVATWDVLVAIVHETVTYVQNGTDVRSEKVKEIIRFKVNEKIVA